MRIIHLILGCVVLVGCGQYANPNDLSSVRAEVRAEIANKRLVSAEETLQYKVEHNEITDDRRNQLISELADQMLKSVDPKAIPDTDQWMYASLLRVTNRWPDAEAALKIAVKVAPNLDRKVNDTLKLAQAQAKNGEVVEALASAQSVLEVPNEAAAPILPSVLYELVPAAEGKGHDKELADLLVKAIACHQQVKVDPNSDSGKAFLFARHHHISKAEAKIAVLAASKR